MWALLLGSLFLAVYLLDALLLRGKDIPIQVRGHSEVRLTVHQQGEWNIDWHVPEGIRARIDVGIALPGHLKTDGDIQTLNFTEDKSDLRSTWNITPHQRGTFSSEHAYTRTSSPLGLWTTRNRLPLPTEFKVYPDLRRDRRTLATLLSKNGQVGSHVQKQTGQGREYDQIREYQVGDSPLDIHWKATAKRNSLMSRTYQIERTQNVVLALDTSRLSARLHPTVPGQPSEPILERYVNTANLLALSTLRSGDRFGFVSFADRVETCLPPGSGPQQLQTLQQKLFGLSPKPVYADFDEWGREMQARFRRRSLVILLTDLSDSTAFENIEPTLRLLSKKHVVAVAMIPLPGVQPLFNGNSHDQNPYQRLAGHVMWEDLNGYQKRLQALSIPLLLSSSERLVLDVVNHYLSIKNLQRL